MRTIGIVLFDRVEELDAVGPWEVLAYWTGEFPEDGWRVVTVAADERPVVCNKGMRIVPDHAFASTPPIDVLLQPGGDGTRPLLRDDAYMEWVRRTADGAQLTTSVCTGALVLAKAGLLAGRPATTHWSAFGELEELDATIEQRPDDRFVDDGDVITSAGVSAGIDMALHLVIRLAGIERAREVKRGIQYDPEPPC